VPAQIIAALTTEADIKEEVMTMTVPTSLPETYDSAMVELAKATELEQKEKLAERARLEQELTQKTPKKMSIFALIGGSKKKTVERKLKENEKKLLIYETILEQLKQGTPRRDLQDAAIRARDDGAAAAAAEGWEHEADAVPIQLSFDSAVQEANTPCAAAGPPSEARAPLGVVNGNSQSQARARLCNPSFEDEIVPSSSSAAASSSEVAPSTTPAAASGSTKIVRPPAPAPPPSVPAASAVEVVRPGFPPRTVDTMKNRLLGLNGSGHRETLV
jgi:hypothetical protein